MLRRAWSDRRSRQAYSLLLFSLLHASDARLHMYLGLEAKQIGYSVRSPYWPINKLHFSHGDRRLFARCLQVLQAVRAGWVEEPL